MRLNEIHSWTNRAGPQQVPVPEHTGELWNNLRWSRELRQIHGEVDPSLATIKLFRCFWGHLSRYMRFMPLTLVLLQYSISQFVLFFFTLAKSPHHPSISKPPPGMWHHLKFIKFEESKVRTKNLPREPHAVAQPTRGGVLQRRWAAWRLWRRTRRGWRGRGCAWSCCAGASLAQRPPRWRRSERWTEPTARKNSNDDGRRVIGILQRLNDEW